MSYPSSPLENPRALSASLGGVVSSFLKVREGDRRETVEGVESVRRYPPLAAARRLYTLGKPLSPLPSLPPLGGGPTRHLPAAASARGFQGGLLMLKFYRGR